MSIAAMAGGGGAPFQGRQADGHGLGLCDQNLRSGKGQVVDDIHQQ
jgi:hypothetical protein